MKATKMLAACLVMGLVAQCAMAVPTAFTEDFENMTVGLYNLVPQNGWAIQYGDEWSVQDYSSSAIPWVPKSTGIITDYHAPVNPNGGNQFVGKGTAATSGNGRVWHAATHSGLVEVSVDFCNGPEHEFAYYQGGLNSRGNWSGSGPGNMVGIYTRTASTYVDPGMPPKAGNWAFNVMAFDEEGTQLSSNPIQHPFWTFDGVEGFDDLPTETWWRMGYTIDTNTRRIVQFKSQDLSPGGGIWIMNNPRAEVDDGQGGTVMKDMYIYGGAQGTDPLDAVGIYNVGSYQLSLYDNVYVGDPYDWQMVPVPEPSTLGLLLIGALGLLLPARRKR